MPTILIPKNQSMFTFLWAPDTPQSVIDEAEDHFDELGDDNDGQFHDSQRWTRTATDGNGLQQGDPTTITWSIVPDGTNINGYNGEPDVAFRFAGEA